MWWALVGLFGGVYVVLRVAGEPRSDWWVLAAIAFLCTIVAINGEVDRMRR